MKNKKLLIVSIKLVLLVSLTALSIFNFQSTLGQTIQENGDLTFIKQPPQEDYILKKFAFISGAISNPGVYEIEKDTKLVDLIELAGGLTEEADKEKINKDLNLSSIVKDSDHIFIPNKSISTNDSTSNESSKININNASESELDSLPGVGASTVQKIIQGRPYSTIDDLKNVSGIGDSKFNQIKDLITVN